eukprot:scaffold2784_cov109-Cylindrotheca_fusiformis.AAC.5
MEGIETEHDECIRGLEFKEPKIRHERHERRRQIQHYVLKEQENFYAEPENHCEPLDDELISSLYRSVNRMCVEEAIRIGKRDASEARILWE